MPVATRLRLLPALFLAAALVACSDDETGPEESHTPGSEVGESRTPHLVC